MGLFFYFSIQSSKDTKRLITTVREISILINYLSVAVRDKDFLGTTRS